MKNKLINKDEKLINADEQKKQSKKMSKKEKDFIEYTRENIILGANSSFYTLEAYRATRTNIMFSSATESGCKRIILTSAMVGEGKSITCINLAKMFASQTDSKILVIDADLRRPRIHLYVDIDNEVGISNVLAGFSELNDVIRSKDGVDYIPSGHIPKNPVELLSSEKMGIVLSELSQRYDYIFIDTPPVALVTEAAAMAQYSTGVILVTRTKYTVHAALQSAISALEFANAKILGFILNDVEFQAFTYSRRGKYRRYGYYKSDRSEKQ